MRALASQNIYSANGLEKMDIETEEKCMCILYRLIEYYPLFEKPIEEGGICDAVRIFLAEDLNDCYPTIRRTFTIFWSFSSRAQKAQKRK